MSGEIFIDLFLAFLLFCLIGHTLVLGFIWIFGLYDF